LRTQREKDLEEINIKSWQKVIELSGAIKFMSSKKIDELEKRIHRPQYSHERIEPLPELSSKEVSDMIGALIQNGRDFAEEMLREAFDYCRPMRSQHKTNKIFRIDKKIIWHGVEMTWGKYRIHYGGYSDRFRVLDRAFHLLDGTSMSAQIQRELQFTAY